MGFILMMPALFIVLILGQLYTDNLQNGWTLVERSLSVVLIPFALSRTQQFSEVQVRRLMDTFIVSAFLAALYCLGAQAYLAFKTGSIYVNEQSTHFLYNMFMHHRLSEPLGLHAIYFSAFIAFAGIYVFNTLFSPSIRQLKKKVNMMLFLFFVVMIFLLKSAIISFGFSLAIVVIILFKIKSISTKRIKIGMLAVICCVCVYAFFAVRTKLEFVNLNYEMDDLHMGMLAIRLSIWENALAIIESNWFLGVGTGDADGMLLNQYKTSGFTIGWQNDYNCHNMYLQYWLGNGMLALGLFIGYLILLLKKALKFKNYVFMGFLIIFALFSFTESTMRVQKGMVFFMVMSSLFYWSPNLWNTLDENSSGT